MSILFMAAAFILAIGVLVTVHEFGHFWVARRVGVRVLRFSVGFGRPLWRRVGRDGVEYVIAMIPLGGYVKMLDEREGRVDPEQRHLAFNRKPLWARNAVILAGPAFNFAFAIIAYWLVFVIGTMALKPVLGSVPPDSPAAAAGFQERDQIVSVADEQTTTWDQALLALLEHGVGESELPVTVNRRDGTTRELRLNVAAAGPVGEDRDLLGSLGFEPYVPEIEPVIGELAPDGAAAAAGLQPGDRIVSVAGEATGDWRALVDAVRSRPGEQVPITVERDGERRETTVTLRRVESGDGAIGQLGVSPSLAGDPYAELRQEVRYGPVAAVGEAFRATGELTALTLKMLWSMVIGEASVKNLSGPLNIAEFAGQSASLGLAPFLRFLALVSISLGVINLMPVPVLDGGHLLFNGIEWIRGGRPLSERAQGVGVQIGLAVLFMVMALAFYNDILRIVGRS